MSLLTTPVPKALVEELEKRFPPQLHTPTDSYPEIMYRSGQLNVIGYIRASHEAQQQAFYQT